MTHPLTDDIAESIAVTELQNPFGIGQLVFTHDDMRGAADWQLEQVIEFLESESCSDYGGTLYYPTKGEDESIRETLLRAMRPQQND